MVARADVEVLHSIISGSTNLALDDLAGVMQMIMGLPPEKARDELLAILPDITDMYGELVGSAAAEWYEAIRAAEIGGSYTARVGQSVPREQVEAGVRWAARHLFDDDPVATAANLSGAVQRYVAFMGRETVARNVELDPARPRFARVPRGRFTCAWCAMLASRGFVYHSRESAGAMRGHYHDWCDCQVVPSFDRAQAHIEGYDPDALYSMYLQAREATGLPSPSQEQVAAQMRALFPDEFTDGHQH